MMRSAGVLVLVGVVSATGTAVFGQPEPFVEQQPVGMGLQERLVLVQDQIQKLQGEKMLAEQQNKTAGEIAALDDKIARLQQEAAALRAELGLAPAPGGGVQPAAGL